MQFQSNTLIDKIWENMLKSEHINIWRILLALDNAVWGGRPASRTSSTRKLPALVSFPWRATTTPVNE